MLICLCGASCTGKTTVADLMKSKINATIYNGKDYLKLAKSNSEAILNFKNILNNQNNNIIYVISDLDDYNLLPPHAFIVLFEASLDVIKERFKVRLHGQLPKPVETMLEKKKEMWSKVSSNLIVNTDNSNPQDICDLILVNIK